MNIYIYGSDRFKATIKSLLIQANFGLEIEAVQSLFRIKTLLETEPNNIYIIDEHKVYVPNKFLKKINFFTPKDNIEKDFLDKYGSGDVCFHMPQGILEYIRLRIELEKRKARIEEQKVSIELPVEEGIDTKIFKNVFDEDDYDPLLEDLIPLQEEEQKIPPRDLTSLRSIDEILEDEIDDRMFELKNTPTNRG